jgi:hypothetical protein
MVVAVGTDQVSPQLGERSFSGILLAGAELEKANLLAKLERLGIIRAVALYDALQQCSKLAQRPCRLASQRETSGFPNLTVPHDLGVLARVAQIFDNPTVRGRRGAIVTAVE